MAGQISISPPSLRLGLRENRMVKKWCSAIGAGLDGAPRLVCTLKLHQARGRRWLKTKFLDVISDHFSFQCVESACPESLLAQLDLPVRLASRRFGPAIPPYLNLQLRFLARLAAERSALKILPRPFALSNSNPPPPVGTFTSTPCVTLINLLPGRMY